jgi:hypothetical protein
MSLNRMAGVVLALALLVGGLGFAACGVAGRYVDVDVEVFRAWGFLGLGTWEILDPSLAAVRIDPLPEEDALRVGEILSACELGEAERVGCSTLAEVGYGLVRSYGITPNLDDTYRVVITNKTARVLGVVLEIDGLNSNGSSEVVGTEVDKKWVLKDGQTVRISGWQVSTDDALAFRFATPSHSHSALTERRGSIRVHVYLLDPTHDEYVKGTEAAELIDQPTVQIPFRSATGSPVERIDFNYARGEAGLGFLCEETEGAGIRISNVVAGTIAELRGLREGDVITYISAVPINSCADLVSYLAAKIPGDRVVLKVHRENRAFLLTLELPE